jgi:hypothetical protein
MSLWKSFRHKLQVAGQLSLRDWLFLVEAWWALLGFRLALRRVPFERLEAFTRPASGKSAARPDILLRARYLQRVVSMAARLHLPSMTCLPRALALRWKLSRDGIPSQLRIGMNKNALGMSAHAWVEVAGEAIGEPDDIPERFKILESPGEYDPPGNGLH